MPARKYTWDSELKKQVERHWKVGEPFTLRDEVYSLEAHFSRLYPSNNNVKAKLRQIMQHLRDADLVEFVDDNGTYKRVPG
jgi:hypothetical protein